jgi:hypothetical protein
MISQLETTILKGFIHNEDYTRKVLPYVKDEYFETSIGRTTFSLCSGYFTQYGECPSRQSLLVQFEQLEGVSEDEFREIGKTLELLCEPSEMGNTEFLVDTTEKWCKERAVYNALLESISIHEGNDINKTRDSIPQLLTEALAVCFDAHVGHDYLGDYLARYDFYHVKENRISFGLEYFDKITDGGLVNKTLNIALAGTGVGKSLFMCSLASTVLLQGKNVLYITAEMAEERIAERIDANLLNTPIQDVKDIPLSTFEDKIKKYNPRLKDVSLLKNTPPHLLTVDTSTHYSRNYQSNNPLSPMLCLLTILIYASAAGTVLALTLILTPWLKLLQKNSEVLQPNITSLL